MKKDLKLHAYVAPALTVVAAAYDEDGRVDACTLAFYTPSSHTPPCLTIAINSTAKRKTLKSILASGAFTVGFPSTGQVREADYLGVESGYDADKLANIGWTTTEGRAVHAPVIDQLGVSIECEVVHTADVGSHTQITGEVKNIQADEELLDERGKVQLERLQPIIYDEEAVGYWSMGEKVSAAFAPGGKMRKAFRGESD